MRHLVWQATQGRRVLNRFHQLPSWHVNRPWIHSHQTLHTPSKLDFLKMVSTMLTQASHARSALAPSTSSATSAYRSVLIEYQQKVAMPLWFSSLDLRHLLFTHYTESYYLLRKKGMDTGNQVLPSCLSKTCAHKQSGANPSTYSLAYK